MSALAEVYRRETESGAVVSYALPSDVPASKPQSGVTSARPRSPSAVTAMRAARLLNSLGRIAKHRRDVGFVGPAAWSDVLALAAEMIRARAVHNEKPVGECDLRKWAAVHVPEAGHGAIAAAWAESEGGGFVPSPAQAGAVIDLRLGEWIEAGRPWGLAPVDAKAETLRTIRANVKRLKDRARAAKRRAGQGARSRDASAAAFCKQHGLALRSFWRWHAKGEAALNEWLAKRGAPKWHENVARYSIKGNTCDETVPPLSSERPVARCGPPKPVIIPSARPMPPRAPMAVRFGMFAMPAPCLPHKSGGFRHVAQAAETEAPLRAQPLARECHGRAWR